LRDAFADAVGAQHEQLPRPYRSELRPMLQPWLGEITRSLQHGVAWLIDYGYAGGTYFAPQRTQGTLRCHFRQRAHDDPFLWPGLQDITAWVDFDALARAATTVGLAAQAPMNQTQFLIEHGLDEVFTAAYAAASDEAARYALATQVKRLTLPGEMGENFKVVRLHRAG
jgi:SAM-dependent MidA family methyltransferase